MKHTFKALLLGVFFLFPALLGFGVFAQSTLTSEYEGIWEFEKAEYLEKETPQGRYLLKETITDVDKLYPLEEKFFYIPKTILITDGLAEVTCSFGVYTGKYRVIRLTNNEEVYSQIMIGHPEEEGLEYNGRILNARGFEYRLDNMTGGRIALTREGIFDQDAKSVYRAVRCILKKIN